MPTYTFEHKETGERETHILSMSERETFLEENPDKIQVIVGAPSLFHYVSAKPSSEFRSMLGQMKKVNPRSTIDTF